MASAHRSRRGHFYASASYRRIPPGDEENQVRRTIELRRPPCI